MKSEVETNFRKSFTEFRAVEYSTQVVAGTNYLVKVDVGSGHFLHIKLHKPLPFRNAPPHLMAARDGKSLSDPLEYFE